MKHFIMMALLGLIGCAQNKAPNCAYTINSFWLQRPISVWIDQVGLLPDEVQATRAAMQDWNDSFGQTLFVETIDENSNIRVYNMDEQFPTVDTEANTLTEYLAPVIFEANIHFNSATYRNAGYDMESLFIHELGHSLGLMHVPDITNVMYYQLLQGQVRRNIKSDNINSLKCEGY